MSTGGMGILRGYVQAAAAVILLSVGSLLSTSGADAREFRAADIQDENYPTVQALRYMDQLIAQRTGGAHRIRVFHSRQLGEESQTIDQTRAGAIDIDRINVAALGNIAPLANVLALPFLFRSLDHLYKVIDGPIGETILNSLEPYGFVGLAYYDSGARSIYTVRKPVQRLADLVGMRIRVQQSDLMEKMIKALGATPLQLPFGQVLTALSTNLVDGAENNWPSYVTTNQYKIARYYTLTEHTMAPEMVIMNRRAWQELSSQDQDIFRAAARESSKYMRAIWQDWEARSRKQAEEAGVTVFADIDRKPFEDATRSLRNELRADPKFRPLIDHIQAVR